MTILESLVLAQQSVGPEGWTIGSIITAIGSVGFAVWFGVYTTTRTIPRMEERYEARITGIEKRHEEQWERVYQIHKDEIDRLHLRYQNEIDKLTKEYRDDVRKLVDDFREEREADRENRRDYLHSLNPLVDLAKTHLVDKIAGIDG